MISPDDALNVSGSSRILTSDEFEAIRSDFEAQKLDYWRVAKAERKLGGLPFDEEALSQRLSWLPTTFSVSEDGQRVKAMGYINGLTLFTATNLVPLLENLLGLFVSLWSRTLSDLRNPLPAILSILSQRSQEGRPKCDFRVADANPEYWDEFEEKSQEWESTAPIIFPELPEGNKRPQVETRGERLDRLNGKNINVITKISEIRLTPDQPMYAGGSWHVVSF